MTTRGDEVGLIRLIAVLERRIATLRGELDRMDSLIVDARKAILSGISVRDLVERPEMLERREALIEALNSVQSALMINRAEGIRILIDEEGLTISDVARLLGHSRQVVRRAYDAASELSGSEDVIV